MSSRFLLPLFLLILLPTASIWGQSGEGPSLGDLARSLRGKPTKVRTVIDNDNMVQVMDQVQRVKVDSGTPLFSFDRSGKNFEMSSPDGTCSLSFNANVTALISDPFLARELPAAELANLDGSATLDSDLLEVSLQNGTGWNLTEITVGLTIVHPSTEMAARNPTVGGAALETVSLDSATQVPILPSRHSDTTVLYHLKGSVAAQQATVFHEILNTIPAPGEEWHWAIVQAKGVPPHSLPKQPAPSELPPAPGFVSAPLVPVPQNPRPPETVSPLPMQSQPPAAVVIGEIR